MAAPIFNGKIILNSATPVGVAGTTWDVELSFTDASGVFSGLDIQINDNVFIDTSPSEVGTITKFRIESITSQDFFGASVRLVFDDNNLTPPLLDFSVGLEGMISRATSLTDLNTVSAPSVQQLPDVFLANPLNSNIWQRFETFGWFKYDFTYEDFATDAQTNSIVAFQLPANVVLEKIIIKHTQNFSGGSISNYNIRIGTQADTKKYSEPFDVFQPVNDDNQQTTSLDVIESFALPTDVYITATSTDGDLDQAAQGALYILVRLSKIQQAS